MGYAIIDLGSNSVRLSVYESENDQILKTFSEKELAGLAGYVTNDILESAGIQKACEVIKNLKEIASRFVEPADIRLFATASLRNISNRAEAVSIIAEETSLIPDVLEGDEEAELGFAGASLFVSCDNGIMIDIGGASTELVLFKDGEAESLISLPVGCLNLSVRYVNEIIPTEQEMKQIKKAIRNQLSKLDWDKYSKYPLIVGTGGTLRAALKLSRELFGLPSEENNIMPAHIKKITKLLKNNKDDIFLKVYKTIPERLLTISTGLAILRQTIEKFGCETISVSKFGVREGYLVDRVLKTKGSYVINQRIEEN
jgi:exopolyphosphatase/guanosine-5'-triphosphate,3'-diphosphate pyrophosphatase